ncbi:sulfite exporter TauE/SafE family protein [Bacillus benzoevorans]|uniref:Probable membrane transporter protein n=1 Tax=Bacillus benzoevorans TaxID=1456 RepID=A0A7X0LX95_9BACI|nr:sulfite exporter TauE/SafE family protein [Bacillus benzoevorans]MBB6446292.1 hypothetical protein [Bacillus benzoevorans]
MYCSQSEDLNKEGEVGLIFFIFVIGFLGSLISGMLGIGGAIINYPLLLYIPPLLGFSSFSPQEVTAMSSVQVFFTTLAAMVSFRKGEYIHKSLVATMGTFMITGSFLGGFGSKLLPEEAINITYTMLTIMAVILMFGSNQQNEHENDRKVQFNKKLAGSLAFLIGGVSGIVGAGGAFIAVPVMTSILKIPMRTAIASSLVITFISSIGSVIGKLMGDDILLIPTITLITASIISAPLGTMLSRHIHVKILKGILTFLLMVSILQISLSIFNS